MKKGLALLLAALIACSITITAFAADETSVKTIALGVGEYLPIAEAAQGAGYPAENFNRTLTIDGNGTNWEIFDTRRVKFADDAEYADYFVGRSVGQTDVYLVFDTKKDEGPLTEKVRVTVQVTESADCIKKALTVKQGDEIMLKDLLSGTGYTNNDIVDCVYQWDSYPVSSWLNPNVTSSLVFAHGGAGDRLRVVASYGYEGEASFLLKMKDGKSFLYNVTIEKKNAFVKFFERLWSGIKTLLLYPVFLFDDLFGTDYALRWA